MVKVRHRYYTGPPRPLGRPPTGLRVTHLFFMFLGSGNEAEQNVVLRFSRVVVNFWVLMSKWSKFAIGTIPARLRPLGGFRTGLRVTHTFLVFSNSENAGEQNAVLRFSCHIVTFEFWCLKGQSLPRALQRALGKMVKDRHVKFHSNRFPTIAIAFPSLLSLFRHRYRFSAIAIDFPSSLSLFRHCYRFFVILSFFRHCYCLSVIAITFSSSYRCSVIAIAFPSLLLLFCHRYRFSVIAITFSPFYRFFAILSLFRHSIAFSPFYRFFTII